MAVTQKPTYYEFFGLKNFEDNMELIKKAYRSMALKHHPDRNKDKDHADFMMKQVNEVYRILSTDKSNYDNHLRRKLGVKGAYKPYKPYQWYDEEAEVKMSDLAEILKNQYWSKAGFGFDSKVWDDLEKRHKERSKSHAEDAARYTYGYDPAWDSKKNKKQQEQDLETQRERREFFNNLTNDEFFAVKEYVNKMRRDKTHDSI